MKITHQLLRQKNPGYALLITVVFISIALLLLVSVMNWTNSSARQAGTKQSVRPGHGCRGSRDRARYRPNDV